MWQVTFLYKLAPGPCPKSYGTNVARLAGIPKDVVKQAAEVSAKLEHNGAFCISRMALARKRMHGGHNITTSMLLQKAPQRT